MLGRVHASAIVERGAVVDAGAYVGALCVVGRHVRLARDVRLHPGAVVTGRTTVGEGTHVHSYAVVGASPQDRKHRPENEDQEEGVNVENNGPVSRVEIGRGCSIREFATVHAGSSASGGLTKVCDGAMLLAYCHVGHDCRIGRNVVLSNRVQLAGHVCVGDRAVLGGGVLVRQFVNVGIGAMVGGASAVDGHVVPYSLVNGNRARMVGANLVGMRRNARMRQDGSAATREALNLIRRIQTDSQERIDSGNLQGLVTSLQRERASHIGTAVTASVVDEILGFLAHAQHECYDWGNQQKRLGFLL